MKLTISKLAKKYGLSRSTLLYYDTIGLLSPCSHQKGEYRVYGTQEQERLKLLCLYRKAGIALKDIKRILDNEKTSLNSCLITRFKQLDRDIMELKVQQEIIANMLQNPSLLLLSRPMTKELWTKILKSSGLTEKMMRNWHIQFEQAAPDILFTASHGLSHGRSAALKAVAGCGFVYTLVGLLAARAHGSKVSDSSRRRVEVIAGLMLAGAAIKLARQIQ